MSIVQVGPGTKRSEGWLWRRWLIDGTRIEPYHVASLVFAGDSVASVAEGYDLTEEQVHEAVEFTTKRCEAARKGWKTRRLSLERESDG